MIRWIPHTCKGEKRNTLERRVASTRMGEEHRKGSELLSRIIILPVHPALDVTRIQLAPPFTVFHTSFLL